MYSINGIVLKNLRESYPEFDAKWREGNKLIQEAKATLREFKRLNRKITATGRWSSKKVYSCSYNEFKAKRSSLCKPITRLQEEQYAMYKDYTSRGEILAKKVGIL